MSLTLWPLVQNVRSGNPYRRPLSARMLAKKLADPSYRAGAKSKIADVQVRLDQVQELYDNGELELLPKFKQRGADKGKRVGFTVKRGVLGPLMQALNAGVKDEPRIESTLTISSWLEAGAPGLRLRDEDRITDGENG